MLREIIHQLGGPKRLAEALGCTPQAVCKWVTNQIPADRAVQIEHISNGKFTCRQLRPDLFEGALLGSSTVEESQQTAEAA